MLYDLKLHSYSVRKSVASFPVLLLANLISYKTVENVIIIIIIIILSHSFSLLGPLAQLVIIMAYELSLCKTARKAGSATIVSISKLNTLLKKACSKVNADGNQTH